MDYDLRFSTDKATRHIRALFDRKKIKRTFLILLGFFITANIWFYSVEYNRYVSQAPVHLKEARVDYVNTMMFHMYYIFFIKTMRIDFQNPILYPFKVPRDYFYHRGLSKLPKDDAERALWYKLFQYMPYHYSVKGIHGSMAKHYGYEFTKKFVDDLYKNIEIFSLYEVSDKQTKDIYEESLEAYINMISLFVHEFHLNKDGYLFRDENIKKVATDAELYKRFENIYNWHNKVAWRYKKEDPKLFNSVVNIQDGWYSAYSQYYQNIFIVSSFILTYKIHNGIFDCQEDKKYFQSKAQAARGLDKVLKQYPKDSYQFRATNQMYYYLYITKSNRDKQPKSLHPLQLSINCTTKNKEKK